MPFMRMHHVEDPKETILNELGDVSGIQLFNNQVMVATYVRPDVTSGGIMLPGATRDEDKYQGKVGLVIKKGGQAFVDTKSVWFDGVEVNVGDWIYFRPAEGWSLVVHGVPCRILDDVDVRGVLPAPDVIW